MKTFNLKVVFGIDPTGMDKDITEEIKIPSDTCLFCFHDKNSRLVSEVRKALEYKGYDLKYHFSLLKIYVI